MNDAAAAAMATAMTVVFMRPSPVHSRRRKMRLLHDLLPLIGLGFHGRKKLFGRRWRHGNALIFQTLAERSRAQHPVEIGAQLGDDPLRHLRLRADAVP